MELPVFLYPMPTKLVHAAHTLHSGSVNVRINSTRPVVSSSITYAVNMTYNMSIPTTPTCIAINASIPVDTPAAG